jgi:hypothetical protein
MAGEKTGEKVACNICRGPPRAMPPNGVGRHGVGADRRSTVETLSQGVGKRFGTGLAGQRIFHIGSGISPATVP